MTEKGESVYIRIYQLSKANKVLKYFGLGVFHTAIEIYNKEYWFGANNSDKSGVCETKINIHKLPLHQRIKIGTTLKTQIEVKRDAYSIRKRWMGRDYDVFFKNCNHFSQEYLRVVLGYGAFPPYVNRITMLEPILRPFIKPMFAIAQAVIPKSNSENS